MVKDLTPKQLLFCLKTMADREKHGTILNLMTSNHPIERRIFLSLPGRVRDRMRELKLVYFPKEKEEAFRKKFLKRIKEKEDEQ